MQVWSGKRFSPASGEVVAATMLTQCRSAVCGCRRTSIVVSSRYAEDWADVRGSVVHAALSQGRVLAR